MLGGGGFTGGVYEIGALRALDLLSVNRTVNEFDIYVGTSAGSFVAGLLAAGPDAGGDVAGRQPAGADAVPATWTWAHCCARTTRTSRPARC